MYGELDYRGKSVLDIGADVGGSANWFLERGARHVIAVEASPRFYECLRVNAERLGNVTAILLEISNYHDISGLILASKPDIIKMDCEGCEVHLTDVPNSILSLTPEYVLETHGTQIFNAVTDKFHRNGYTVWSFRTFPLPWHPFVRILYAVKVP